MFNFSNTASSPAMKSLLDSQFSLYSDVSKSIYESMQKLNGLNIQVAQTLMEETIVNAKEILSAADPQEVLSITAGQAQPAAEKVRAYREHVQNIVAETQANVAKTVGSHMPDTTRATEEVVKEVAQKASEETAKATQRQKESMEKLTTPLRANNVRATTSNVIKTS
ncbi:MAG: granule-associated protein [Noviherbaspirillum sp.]|nr:granule-associated protein [Noviherbaspirillum sp.]